MESQREKEMQGRGNTHKLIRDVLKLTEGRDCINAYYDVLLVADCLKRCMDEKLGKVT